MSNGQNHRSKLGGPVHRYTPRMRRLFMIMLLLGTLAGGFYLYTNGPTPPDFGAMAQQSLVESAAATTDDDRLTAIFNATNAFAEIVFAIDGVADAQLALPHLTQLADEAKRLDDELKQDSSARRALMRSRQSEVDDTAMILARMMLSTAFRVEIMKVILNPVETITSVLQ